MRIFAYSMQSIHQVVILLLQGGTNFTKDEEESAALQYITDKKLLK